MTGLATALTSTLAAALVAIGGVVAGGTTDSGPRTAVVIDASLARDGRDLVSPGLRDVYGEVRIPRTSAEAETDLRYFAKQGYRLVAVGPEARAAADALGLAVTVRSR
jgi:hypothetical protein